MKTSSLKNSQISRQWHLIDLKDQTLGRISTQIANLLMGKHKAFQSPNLDGGDYVVAINAKHIKVTGKKLEDKLYQSHSGYPGGFKEISLGKLMEKDPRKVIEAAVKGMLPKNKLQTPRLRRFKVYVSATHPHQAHFETSPVDEEAKKKKKEETKK